MIHQHYCYQFYQNQILLIIYSNYIKQASPSHYPYYYNHSVLILIQDISNLIFVRITFDESLTVLLVPTCRISADGFFLVNGTELQNIYSTNAPLKYLTFTFEFFIESLFSSISFIIESPAIRLVFTDKGVDSLS